MTTSAPTKPYRTEGGLPMSHGELTRRHRLHTQHYISQVEEDQDRDLNCLGVMEFHGEVITRADGSTYVNWDGDIWHHELTCSECGFLTCVDSEFKQRHIHGVSPQEEAVREKAKADASW